jgi:F-type H+-transporting ATPase subunit b
LAKAEEITKQYEEQLATAREQSQAVNIKARKEANEFVAAQIEEGKLNAEKLVNETTQQLLLQKEQTLQTLEAQLDILSDDIKKKLLTVSVIS